MTDNEKQIVEKALKHLELNRSKMYRTMASGVGYAKTQAYDFYYTCKSIEEMGKLLKPAPIAVTKPTKTQ